MSLEGLFTLTLLLSGLLLALARGRFLRLHLSGVTLTCSPVHYGILITLITTALCWTLILIWLIVENWWLGNMLINALSQHLPNSPASHIQIITSQIYDANPSFLSSNPFTITLHTNYETALAQSRFWQTLSVISLFLASASTLLLTIKPHHKAQWINEKAMGAIMLLCGSIAVLTTLGVVLSLIVETIRFFELVSPLEFLFGFEWSPQTALRPGQIAAEGKFGAIPLFTGTLLITFIALLIAGPVGLLSAIYMTEYASEKLHAAAKPVLEILAGIPTVVYGFFAALTLAPFIRGLAETLGLAASSESALAAGIVMGIMIIPFISSLSDDVISAVPHNLREGSYALGATQSETIIRVVLPAAMPGIASAFLLAISRAIGETMIVVMAAGLAAKLTANPLEAVTTVTVQIVTLLTGDQEFDSAKTLAAFALGMTLFIITLTLNTIALIIVQRYRNRYE